MSESPASAVSSLHQAEKLASAASDAVQETWRKRKPVTNTQVTPDQLREGIDQFFQIAGAIRTSDDDAPYAINNEDVTQIGDYGLSLIQDMAAWAGQMELEAQRRQLDNSALGIAAWIIANKGEIRTAHSIVNAIAELANSTRDPEILASYAKFTGDVIDSCANIITRDLEKTDPLRPWRLLQFNRAIMATRSYRPELMRQAYDAFVQALPEEAPGFFREGMNEMERLGYPEHVREVVQEYFDEWTRRAMN